MVTLHAYILRELLKTLGLTVAALTVLFTMGGGLYNIVRSEGISPGDVLQFMPQFIPSVATVTLPMAALFAATMVYGRLAADNELTACRAAGINVHRTFLPSVLLAIFVAGFSLLFGNFVVPGLITQIGDAARHNLRDMVQQHLQQEGFIHHRSKRSGGLLASQGDEGERYTLTAERVQGVAEDALHAKGFETGAGLQYLLITNPTFLHVDARGKLVRYTVAQHGLCMFDTRPDPVELTLFVHDGRDFEIGKRAVYIGQQQVGPIALPLPPLFRLSFADLRSLLYWQREPWANPRLHGKIKEFLAALAQQVFYLDVAERLNRGQPVELQDDRGRRYTITGEDAQRDQRGLSLTDGRVTVQRAHEDAARVYLAQRVELRARPLPSGQMPVEISLLRTPDQDVLEYGPNDTLPRRKSTLSLDGAEVSDEFVKRMQQYTPAMVVDPAVSLPAENVLGEKRLSLQKAAREMQRKVTATIHWRLAYCASVLVTALMGAALGVVFRGSRALAAFALAMIPFFSVWILTVLGQHLTKDPHTTHIGPLVTWGGLVMVLVADLVILRLGVRR